MFSEIAVKIFSAKRQDIIKSNAHFYNEFYNLEKWQNLHIDTKEDKQFLAANNLSVVCIFDKYFPKLNKNIKASEKPFLFVFRGNIELLSNISCNVAVVGLTKPTKKIIEREKNLVESLLKNNCQIVSGLALGCDSVAHKTAVERKRPTIAFLPCELPNIYPKQNEKLASEIVQAGGLVVSEYVKDAKNKYETISRFIERDRLQAMFAKAVILVASNRKGEGDSGSRHAMQKAKEYGQTKRLIMFNAATDKGDPNFGLNQDMASEEDVEIVTTKRMEKL